jgi:hypothetical protein
MEWAAPERPGTASLAHHDEGDQMIRQMPSRTESRASSRRVLVPVLALLASLLATTNAAGQPADEPPDFGPLPPGEQVRGWNVLTDSVAGGLRTIEAAADYDINHLQISHDVIHNLEHVRNSRRLEIAETYVAAAREAGIQEVTFWDRSLYSMSYYPDEFKTGPGGTLDLDNPDFWEWFKADYREMLDIAPDIDGLILTFIETSTRVEQQHSEILKTDEEKLAYLVDQVADVVVDEYGMNLYVRNFGYYPAEILRIVGAIELIENPKVRVMNKETPHDFFITHPVDYFTRELDREVLIEFDTTGEFHGQGVISNTFPEVFIDRWRHFEGQENVIGYVARTDRYRTTSIVDTPTEINLYGLKRAVEDPDVTVDDVYREFITDRYGTAAVPAIEPAFRQARETTLSTMYTLGLNISNHSQLDFDPYCSSYHRHVSGKWLEPPEVSVKRTVNRSFHYWTDLVDHLAPVSCKQSSTVDRELPWVVEEGWLDRNSDKMTEEYLRYIIKEKDHGVALAETSLQAVQDARDVLPADGYEELLALHERTLITAKLYRAVATAYFGYRVYVNDVEPKNEKKLVRTIWEGLDEVMAVAQEIRAYDKPVPVGQWNWRSDAGRAETYYDRIANGWDRYGNVAVPRPDTPDTSITVTPSGGAQVPPGGSFELSATFAVGGEKDAALDVTLAPRVPSGWTVAGEPVEDSRVASGEELQGTWTITVPENASTGTADVAVVATFTAKKDETGEVHETEQLAPVEVLPDGWLVVREAEAPANTLSGTARLSGCGPCSGGVKVGSLGRGPNNYVTINDVTVDEAGEYTMIVDYLVNGTRSFLISINGRESFELSVSGTTFNEPRSTEINVLLDAGANTVKFHHDDPDTPAPDLDRIVIAESN